jgi:hypothetical protein
LDPNGQASSGPAEEAAPAQPASGGKKGGKWAAQDTLDWQRKRKDNHVRLTFGCIDLFTNVV